MPPLVRLLPCALAALALAGCTSISSTATTQPASMGPVRLTTSICANGSPNCSTASNTGLIYGFLTDANSDEKVPAQLLYGVRLPDGTTPPETLTATLGDGTKLDFARSSSYEAQLQSFEPAPSGEHWWGWLSSTFTYSRKSTQSAVLTVETALPRPADGGAFPSPLHWRPVVGEREVSSPLPASRPVACGANDNEFYTGSDEMGNDSQPTIVCVDSPDASATRGFLEAPVTDFGITPGEDTHVPAGTSVNVVFQARRTGPADTDTSFALTVSGGPPGGSVTLDHYAFGLGGDNLQPVLATVAVPSGAAPGPYPITVTATAPNKPTRSATATLDVEPVATPTPGPTATPTVGPDRTAPTLTKVSIHRKRLRFTLSEAATVTVRRGARRVRRTLFAGRRSLKLPHGKSRRIKLSAVDAAGNRSATTTLKKR